MYTIDPQNWSKIETAPHKQISSSDLKIIGGLGVSIDPATIPNTFLQLSSLLLLLYRQKISQTSSVSQLIRAEKPEINPLPFIIGLTGSVASGKSTFGRLLKLLLSKWPIKVETTLITTDNFLYPNQYLQEKGLLDKKGFPLSYNTRELKSVLKKLQKHQQNIKIPIYDHIRYDIIKNEYKTISPAEIIIIEGLNVLQPHLDTNEPLISDNLDFSIYIDANEQHLEKWYINRFLLLKSGAFCHPNSYFKKFSNITDNQAKQIAKEIWQSINLPNLQNYIHPTMKRANLVFHKSYNHELAKISLNKL